MPRSPFTRGNARQTYLSANYVLYRLEAREILYLFIVPLPYQRRLFHARRPDLLRPSRIPGTLAISTNASSHFILPTIPDIKPFYKNSRQQESKKTIAIGLGASRRGVGEVFQGPGFVDRGSWTRKNRIKGMPDPSY